MKTLSRLFFNCSIFALLPVIANAAGTYYTGGYQSPQARYHSNHMRNVQIIIIHNKVCQIIRVTDMQRLDIQP